MVTDIQLKAMEAEYRQSISHLPVKERTRLLREWRAEQAVKAATTSNSGNQAEQTVKEAMDAVPAKAVKRILPHGPLTWIRPELDGYRDLEVGVNLYARWDALGGPVKDDDGLGQMRRLMTLFCDFRNWDSILNPLTEEPFPRPVYGEPETYVVFGRQLLDLGIWLIHNGVGLAAEQELKNSGRS